MACSVGLAALPHQIFHRLGAAPHQMMRKAAPPPAEHGVLLSDFDWIGDLGSGGFARVSKVRHRRSGAVFALKVSRDADPSTEEGEEAEVLRRAAGSPHVVACHALLRGAASEPAACVLEFMDAGCLRSVLRRRRALGTGAGAGIPEPALAEVAAHCAEGLAQLHSLGVAHLDVKPDNFLTNSNGEVKIADFNTSKILYGGGGGAGERRVLAVPITDGTSCYFSPERFAPGARAGPSGAMAADVWGLGVTVLELFLGRFVVSPKLSDAELELAICHGRHLRVPEEAEASAELRDFVAACLEREPARRATVPQLLAHPFLARRDVEASRRALREIIVETL
ncbi:unnamed protein product [Urochloa decumbens]|uniref:mitogen-activated protein kinase kinase n=1 Tax=Urochloa decumbens TaxID=240449 RepID=A0ABC9EUB6_9POAL